MASWMVYATVAAAGLGAMALLAEWGFSLMGRPRRWPWLLAMLASVAWPFLSATVLGGAAAAGVTPGSVPPPGAGTVGLAGQGPGRLLPALSDAWLIGGWALASGVVLALLLLSAESLKSERRRWRSGRVAGEAVFVSGSLGPAVSGVIRPRIVLPRWALELDESVQRLILLHEREHVRAGDTRVLAAALIPLVVFPWCVPLWWQLHRLRLAIEADCDARLLRAGASARAYAEALLLVARRRRGGLLPLATMAPSRKALERRIRLMAGRSAPRRPRAAAALMAAAGSLGAVTAAALPVPEASPVTVLETRLRAAGVREADEGPLPDGSLPGDPGEERLAAEIGAHHRAAVQAGLPPASVVWFIAGRDGAVRRTGIERGAERDVLARLRARYPREMSDWVLAWDDVEAAGGAGVVWILGRP